MDRKPLQQSVSRRARRALIWTTNLILTSLKGAASGRTIITGHLHRGQVVPYTDYSGIRWGVDHGCLAATTSRAFVNYTESNPLNWRSSFCVLTWAKGVLLFPELVVVFDEGKGLVQWRGELLKV